MHTPSDEEVRISVAAQARDWRHQPRPFGPSIDLGYDLGCIRKAFIETMRNEFAYVEYDPPDLESLWQTFEETLKRG